MVGKDDIFPVAIIGIGCRMPGGVTTPEGFWEVLRDGKDCISEVPASRWSLDKFHDEDQAKPDRMVTRRCGFIDGIDEYDNTFFRTSPKEAASMDPQQRVLMEVSHEAFEDAGIIPDELKESCGVFVGIGLMDYPTQILDVHSSSVNAYTLTGAAHSVAANRISYAFNLTGPSLAVDTACSSSMTAMHMACCALWNHECDLAVLGGANAVILPDTTVGFSALGVLSPDGKCCPFSDSAKGYVRSEGWGAMILKPLDKAMADNDHIYATIIGTTVGASGYTQSLTMPSAPAQQYFMEETYKKFNIDMNDIDYLEAHGTGTPVGDPIEAEAIGMTFGPRRAKPLKIGSVKSNFGHCECSAGAVSTIKATLMLHKGYLVPTINYENPNPQMDLDAWNLEVHTSLDKIKPDTKRKAIIGVNSFGFAGSLAHAILQEAPDQIPKKITDPVGWSFGENNKCGKTMIIPLSAKSTTALKDLAVNWQTFEANEDAIQAIGWQATHRKHHECRMAVFAKSGMDFKNRLNEFIEDGNSDGILTGTVYDAKHKICFVFPGQGQQWAQMGKQLYSTEPLFRETIETCDGIFRKLSGWSLVHDRYLFNGHSQNENVLDDESINDMEISQPAILFLQIGLYELWRHWGLKPDVVVGHSLGEVAAAYASGGLTLEEAVKVIYYRSINQAMLKGAGSMVAVRLNTEEAEEVIRKQGNMYIAAENAPGSLTLAGSLESVHNVANDSTIKAKELRVQCAFHTPYMDPMEKPFRASMKGAVSTPAGKTTIPFYSTLTGECYDGDFKTDYWWQNIRNTVKFQPAVENLLREIDPDVFIECAASATLLTSVKQIAKGQGKTDLITVTSGQRNQDDRVSFLNSLGNLYTNGLDINWKNVTNDAGQWADIPKYPWQHGSFWIEGAERRLKRLGLDDLTYSGVHGNLTYGKFSCLTDYIVKDENIFPVSGYVEYAIQSSFDENQKPAVVNINFMNDLVWPESPEGSDPCVMLKMNCVKDGSFVEVISDGKILSSCEIASTSPQNVDAVDIKAVKSRCNLRHSKDDIYNNMSALGFNYGPAFKVLDDVMIGDGEAIGYLRAASDKKQRIQTTLLDGCFQLLLHATKETILYLPVAINKLNMCVTKLPVGQQLLSYTRITDCNSRLLIGDILILTEDGCVLAEISGVKCQNVNGTKSEVEIEKCLYETVWQPSNACLGSTSILSEVFKDIYQTDAYADELSLVRRAEKCTSAMRGIAVAYIKNGFSTVDESTYKVNPLYVKRLKVICQDELAMDIPFNKVHDKIKELGETVPELDQELRMIKNLGDNFPKTLTEPGSAVKILFRPEFLPNYFIESLSTRLFYRAGADVIQRTVKKALQHKQVVRILEIGGRMGGLSKYILEPLKELGEERRLEFIFTDLSVTFFMHAQGTLEEYPFIKYQQLDIEKDIVSQGFAPGSIDLVVCLDTIHSLVDIHNGLDNIRELLTDDGMFLMYEATNTCHVAELVFGSLELCWAYTDFRKDRCWLSQDGWTQTMTDNGFVDVVAETTENEFFHTMYLGRKPSKSVNEQAREAKKYMLVVDGTNSQLERGIRKNLSGSIATVKFAQLTNIATKLDEKPCEVIYIWSEADASNQSLLSLLKTVDMSPESFTRVWVVTSGSNLAAQNIMGSTAIGIVRSVTNTFNTPVFSIDLDPKSPTSVQAQLFSNYMATDDHTEREIAIRNQTYLYPRIANLYAHETPSLSSEYWQLSQNINPDIPSLDDIGVSYVMEMIPSDGEVLVRVQSAALNSTDISKALEMPDANKPYAEKTFGCELSGIVEKLGEGVTSVKVGDEIIGFGEQCLASHAICNANLIVKKPKCISWDKGAGVPIAFTSAYHIMVERAHLQKGETVLIHSACSDIGLSAIAVAKMIGANVICTEATHKKRKFLTENLGIEYVCASTNFYNDVIRFTNEMGVDVVLNSLHNDYLIYGIKCLAPGGRFCDIGKRTKLPTANFQALLENKSFISFELDNMIKLQKKKVQKLLKNVSDLLQNNSLKPIESHVFPITQCQEVFAMAVEDSHIGKIIFSVSGNARPQKINQPSKIFKQNASYIITDAFGGIGLPMSRWLASKGAKHIVMVSQQECINSAGQRTVEYLRSIGVNVYLFSKDLSKPGDVQSIFKELSNNKVPAVKGIFLLSGYISTSSLHNLTPAEAEKIFTSKATVAQNFHNETNNADLDYFVALSSIVSTSGHWSEPVFVAANSFVDSLATVRRDSNLPALSIQVGPLTGAESIDINPDIKQALTAGGHLSLHIDEFLKTLSVLLQSLEVPPVVSFANQNWTATQACSYEGNLKFKHLVEGEQVAKTDCSLSLEDLEQVVTQKMSKLLCVDPASIDINRPMINYGVDSLMAVEMVTWASKELSVIVSQLDILGGITTKLLLEKALNNELVLPMKID
ncbi:probable polyketide synthase 37 [Anneissia japonica]|uniref:probable polyketide synthase 37 n=1 Tax=Anneissia japonica TaxID=1529436 RepID=UPI0014258ED4|nr:probable polyketide synthase 37 [Anneissia japonica]